MSNAHLKYVTFNISAELLLVRSRIEGGVPNKGNL